MTKSAPYPCDTRAKGWRFELDHERIRQSDTWALAPPEIRLDRVRSVVAIDPQATNSDESDETGIVAASCYGGGEAKRYSVDGDYSGKYSPNGWATKAMGAYDTHRADAIVIETNQGGDMAEETLRNAGFKGRIVRVHASKGKFARAEPISALYAQGKVAHHGALYVLENQMMKYVPTTAKKSPDRLDAMVYALTELAGNIVLRTVFGLYHEPVDPSEFLLNLVVCAAMLVSRGNVSALFVPPPARGSAGGGQ